MGSVIKDLCYIFLFSFVWYFIIIVWYWLDAARGPNIIFHEEPDFEVFQNLRDEFLTISSDRNFVLIEVLAFVILVYTAYKLFALLIIVLQLLIGTCLKMADYRIFDIKIFLPLKVFYPSVGTRQVRYLENH